MIENLTKRTVDSTKKGKKDVFIWDEETKGFGLKVTPAGNKVFIYQYRPKNGKGERRRATLGSYGSITAGQARGMAKEMAGHVAAGKDPIREAQAAHQAEAEEMAKAEVERLRKLEETSVKVLMAEYLEDRRLKKSPRTYEAYESQARLHIIPVLGEKPVADISHRDVDKLHASMSETPVVANRCVALLSAFLTWTERQGFRLKNTNPASDIELYDEESRERFLTVDEVARLAEALAIAEREGLPTPPSLARKPKSEATQKHRPKSLAPIPANPFVTAAIRFLMLTGWREQEALTLRWKDLDFERGIATLPSTKTGKSHRPLGAPALALLDELPRLSGNPHVFPGSRAGEPLHEIRRTWYAARHAAGLDDVRLHDLRHTVASFAVAAGYSLFLTGKLLGHSNSKTTQKYAHLEDDARRATADGTAERIASAMQIGKEASRMPSVRAVK